MKRGDARRRFWRLSAAGICFQGGAAAVDSGTIIATLVHGLTGSVVAVGAVRGMVNSLADSYSVFYNSEQMSALNARRKGVFEGIGVEVRLKYDEAELSKLQNLMLGRDGADNDINYDPRLIMPSVIVSTVVEGGPADSAGLRVGDRITRLNGKWTITSLEVLEFHAYKDQFNAGELAPDEFQTIDEY